jgi:hypothetical protein
MDFLYSRARWKSRAVVEDCGEKKKRRSEREMGSWKKGAQQEN